MKIWNVGRREAARSGVPYVGKSREIKDPQIAGFSYKVSTASEKVDPEQKQA
jgi:hypothetical protein